MLCAEMNETDRAFAVQCSRFFLSRIVEEFNMRGEWPTAKEVAAAIEEKRTQGTVQICFGQGENVEDILKRHAAWDYYAVRSGASPLEKGYWAAPKALVAAARNERDPRYYRLFMISVQ